MSAQEESNLHQIAANLAEQIGSIELRLRYAESGIEKITNILDQLATALRLLTIECVRIDKERQN